MKNLFIYILFLTPTFLLAQSSYNIQFQDELVTIEENINSFQWDKMPATSKFQNGYYGWIQFFETPNQEIQNDFKRRGLELIEYLPNKAYVFYFPENVSIQFLRDNGVRAIVPIDGKHKLSAALKVPSYPDYAIDGNNILVTISYYRHTNSSYVIEALAKQQIAIKKNHKTHNIIEASLPIASLEALSSLPFIKWVQLKSAPAIENDTRSKSLNRSNSLDSQTATGRNYTGKGIGVMVRDRGTVGPHIDFQGRLDNGSTVQDNFLQNHGDGVAGVLAGAGNLNPVARGMAIDANIYNIEYEGDFLDSPTLNLISDGSVQITSTSLGNVCDEYLIEAITVDEQINTTPVLMHVLSGGNANGTDCGLGAGGQWANMGGDDKGAKNIIAVANVNFDGSIVGSSSRGPAIDGRIKPDISAQGAGQLSTDQDNGYYIFGGTSAAAPGIAGISAQLYEAYGDLNGGAFPSSALIKAILLNTANDAGNVGPDFIYGWGIVNALQAVKVIEEGRYLSESISQGATNNHSFNVPSGTSQVRFMVYWADVPGALNANPSLVNDLDLVVTDPATNTLLPWILDSTFDPIALNTPATTGPDHLNNMEQVLINTPTAGDYNIDISGFNIPIGPQEYVVVYELISDNLTLTYPNGEERFVGGETEIIHWDATNTTENFELEYSIDGGSNWTTIATVGSNSTNYAWTIPSTVTGSAQISVTSGSYTDTSDASFFMTEQVEGFTFSQVCPDEVTFEWDALIGAESYDVYLLGTKFMEIAGSATSTSITLPIVADPSTVLWAAIVANSDSQNWSSRRTIAISNTGLLGCELPNDVEVLSVVNDVYDFSPFCSGSSEVVVSATINNPGSTSQSNFEVSYQVTGQAAVTEMFTDTINGGEQVVYDFATPVSITNSGPYMITISVSLTGDDNSGNDEASLEFFALVEGTSLDFVQDFEEGLVTPAGWLITNDDDLGTWIAEPIVPGSDGILTTAFFVDNYWYDAPGEEDILTTEFFDLTTAVSPLLTFDLAKALFSNNASESLRVEVVTACVGSTPTIVYEKSGNALSTASIHSNFFEPDGPAEWRNEQVDLSDFSGEVVQLRFVNVNAYSNNTYIDNIKVNQLLVGIDETIFSNFKLSPNPASENVYLTANSKIASDATIVISNNLGQTISNLDMGESDTKIIDISKYSSGIYLVTITSKGISETKKLIIE